MSARLRRRSPSPDPNQEEETTGIPYRTWTGILTPPLLSTPSTVSTSYQEQILTPPTIGNGYFQGIQEWLIGMVWFAQPPNSPIGGTSEWSTWSKRINQWSGGAEILGGSAVRGAAGAAGRQLGPSSELAARQ